MLRNVAKEIVPLATVIGGGYLCVVAPETRDAIFPLIAAVVAWSLKGNGNGNSSGARGVSD
jgi:hypothetical protein